MRSQARWDHRTPDQVDPPDDWVNGSWTVDCVCGVNFDDGEEMVNCDECGVWVHTRCSRYVKSEKLFACDKCKSDKNKKYCEIARIEEETETEVAQLLVDLPTKTLVRSLGNPAATHGIRRLLIPKEERVHVQGIPVGDVGIFCGSGLSSVFGAELWRSTGYVPKKFNFQYKEFECWNEGNENLSNNGDVNAKGLSLLKDKAGLTADSVNLGAAGTKTQGEESKKKTGEGEDCDVRNTQRNDMKKKDRSLSHSTMIHHGKYKKENSQSSKDVTAKKKARVVHVEVDDSKKRSPSASRSASTPSSDAKQSAFHKGRGFQVDENVIESEKYEKIKGNVPAEPSSKGFSTEGVEVDDLKHALAFSGQTLETSCVVSTHGLLLKARPNDECDQLAATFQNSSRIGDGVQSLLDHNDSRCLPAKTEDVVALDNMNDYGECVSRGDQIKTEQPVEYLENIAPRVKDSHNVHNPNGKMSLSRSKQENTQVDINDSGGVSHVQVSAPCDGKLDDAGRAPLPQHHDVHLNVIKKAASIKDVQSIDQKVIDVDKKTVATDCQIDQAEEVPSEPILFEINGKFVSSDNSGVVGGSSLVLKQARHSEEPSESCETTLISSEQLSKRKMVVSLGKSSVTTATTLLSKTPASDSHRTIDAQNYKCSTQQNVVSEHETSSRKDSFAAGFVKDRERSEKPKKIAKEFTKSFTSSVKTSNLSKIPGSSNSTKTLSDLKESVSFSSTKPSLLQNILSNPMSGESATSLQLESATFIDNTTPTSGLMQTSETVTHLSCQPSSKVNHTPQMHHSAAPSISATLSDEELALLLHHELNSSPRVPRVPRMRHAGSLPQLAPPTGANMLMKRSSSSSVGKDHGLVFKRKEKSTAKEGIQNSQELQDESRNVKRSPLSPIQRTNDSAHTTDSVINYGSAAGVQSVNRSIPCATSSIAGNASLASAETSERNVSSTYKSPRNASDDETGTDVRPTHRTLPGLLSEIMNKRMTYEELCNAVLPHWPYLRKQNGERYAYSSHSQAVLDCLRNRSEWARLVDRGPKTNAGRKRRRSDGEAPSFESEDSESKKNNTKGVDRTSAVESRQDRFPKGKRKARKRSGRLALQGRGLNNMVIRRGRRQKEVDVSYDEDCSLSSSSSTEESMSSGDETIQRGGRTSLAASSQVPIVFKTP